MCKASVFPVAGGQTVVVYTIDFCTNFVQIKCIENESKIISKILNCCQEFCISKIKMKGYFKGKKRLSSKTFIFDF